MVMRLESVVYLNNKRVTVFYQTFLYVHEFTSRLTIIVNRGWPIIKIFERYKDESEDMFAILYAIPDGEDSDIIVEE